MTSFFEWARKYKLLLIIYVLGMVFGIREFLISRQGPAVDMLSDRWADMTQVVAEVNPDDPDTEFLLAIQELREGDPEEYIRRFEAALDDEVKHNEFLLQDYAQFMLNRGTDWRRVNQAVNRWRENFPFSGEVLELQLGAGPANPSESATIRRELLDVPWIGDAIIEPYAASGQERWRVLLSFRPPEEVDVREAIAAVSIVSIPEADRARLRVSCLTFSDCRVEPR